MAFQLTAEMDGGKVVVTGDKSLVRLAKKEPPRKFDFRLHDRTGLNVRFSSLDAAESRNCPPPSGINTDQIIDVDIEDKKASFTDENSGPARSLCYAWIFECDDPAQRPSFDPVIENGGGEDH